MVYKEKQKNCKYSDYCAAGACHGGSALSVIFTVELVQAVGKAYLMIKLNGEMR